MRHLSTLQLQHLLLSAMFAFYVGGSASAAPIQIDYGSITPSTLEDFESQAVGDLSSPVSFNGFTFSETGTPEILEAISCDGFGSGQCLVPSSTDSSIVFGGLSATAFGFDLFTESDLTITVVGNSGSAAFDISAAFGVSASGLFGFFDPLGLISVSIIEQGASGGGGASGAASSVASSRPGGPFNKKPTPGITFGITLIDDVVTGTAPAPVPVPAAAPLFAGGVLITMLRRRRTQS